MRGVAFEVKRRFCNYKHISQTTKKTTYQEFIRVFGLLDEDWREFGQVVLERVDDALRLDQLGDPHHHPLPFQVDGGLERAELVGVEPDEVQVRLGRGVHHTPQLAVELGRGRGDGRVHQPAGPHQSVADLGADGKAGGNNHHEERVQGGKAGKGETTQERRGAREALIPLRWARTGF
jgi:hypothetical protein